MFRYAIAAAGLLAVTTAGFAVPADAQCWWTGFNYGCSVPAPYVRPHATVFLYGYGYSYGPQPWWRFGYEPYP